MYWLLKMHITAIGDRFIAVSKKCITDFFNTLKHFMARASFIQTVRNSGLCKIIFQVTLS